VAVKGRPRLVKVERPVQLVLFEGQSWGSPIDIPAARRRLGRPRALSPQDLLRVLSLSRAGLGTRAIATALRETGVDVSRPTIQRALKGRGAYALAHRRARGPDVVASG